MKLLKILTVILSLAFLAGCAEDEWVEIDSLSADGDEFFTNQKVKLWMAIRTSNLPDVDYKWSCDAGTLTQPQGLDEMTWQAPSAPGTYRVSCTVTIGNESETRHHDMYVSSFYFEKFEKTSYTFKGQSSTTLSRKTETVNGKSNGYLEASVKSTSSSNRYIYYNFNYPELKVPFSCMARTGWISDFPTDTVVVGSSTYANKMNFQLTLNRDPDAEDSKYIDDIRFEWFPVGVADGPLVDDETGQVYNACLMFQENELGAKEWHQVSANIPALTLAKGERKKVALNIKADYVVEIYVDGNLALATDAIKSWRTANASKDDIYVNEWRSVIPNGPGGNKPPKIFFDNAYGANDGSILK